MPASCPPPGVSICQELAADEEEDLDYLQVDNSNPTELSTALMKALRVKEQQQEENRECLVLPVPCCKLRRVHLFQDNSCPANIYTYMHIDTSK